MSNRLDADHVGDAWRVDDPTLCVRPCKCVEDARRLVTQRAIGKCVEDEL